MRRALHDLSIGSQALWKLALRQPPADVYLATSPPLLAASATVREARRRGKRSVLLAHDLVSDLATDVYGTVAGMVTGVARRLEAWTYREADCVIALTEAMAERIAALSERVSPVPVIRIWADDELLDSDPGCAGVRFRRDQEIDAGMKLLGFAGNFGRKQHLAELAEAAVGLPRDHVFVFMGDGPARPEIASAQARASGRVRWLPPQPLDGLHAFLGACDASVVVAWTQNHGSLFPSKVANVLAAGCPVIAVTTPGSELARLIEREALGTVCTSLAPEAIREALQRGADLGRDAERRARCRAYAERHLRRPIATQRFVEEVERLVASQPLPPPD